MSNASRAMNGISRSEWPFGYIYVLTVNPTSSKLSVDICEVHIYLAKELSATLNFRVFDLNKNRRTYSIGVYRDEGITNPVFFAEVAYIDAQSDTICFSVTGKEEGVDKFVPEIMRILHPMIIERFVTLGRLMKLDGTDYYPEWYMGFNKSFLNDIETYSKLSLNDSVARLREMGRSTEPMT